MSLLDKASIISVPLAYDQGTYNNVKPMQVIGPANEVINGTFDANTDWTLGVKWSISDSKLNSVGTASGTSASQSTSITAGKIYRVKYTISQYAAGGVYIQLGTANGTTRTDDGVYTEYITAAGGTTISLIGSTASNTFAIDNLSVFETSATDFTFERSSVGTRTNEAGLIEEMAADIPRINYEDGIGALLLEPQSTNLCSESSNVDNWSNLSNVTATAEYDYSPTGDFNGNRLLFTANGYAYHNDNQVPSTEYTISVWAKRNADAAQDFGFFVDSATGTIASVFSLTDRWQRYTYTYTASNNGFAGLAGLSGADISFYGFQREALAYATTLINTSGTAVTRTIESCNDAGSTFTIDSIQGVLYAEIAAIDDDGTYRYITLSDGSSANVVSLLYSSTTNQIQGWVRVGGTLQAQINRNLFDVKSYVKCALKYENNIFKLFVNGENVGEDLSGSVFSADTLNTLAFDNGGGVGNFYGRAKSVIVFPESLSDEEMETLTGGSLSAQDYLDILESRVTAEGGIIEDIPGALILLEDLESC